MKKRFPFFMAITAMIMTLTIVVFPMYSFAAIPDGTYELKYEMKEAGNENTSIADGYFTKPAKLIVKNGVQTIQLTLTGSNYIDSLLAPSGPVVIVSEDKVKFIRTVKFRVDGDLSKPLPMEMHIIVPDLYDMTHTARAVFDTSGLSKASSNEGKPVKEETKKDPPKTETKPAEKDKKSESVETSKSAEKDKSTEIAVETSKQEDNEEAEETEEAGVDEEAEVEEGNLEDQEEGDLDEIEVAVNDEMTDIEVKDANEERGSTLPFWIASIFFVGCIAGFMFWKNKNK
jgi:heme-binding NEAT domain protein